MTEKYQKLNQVMFYDCGGVSYSIGVVKNSECNKYYVPLTRNTVYLDKAGNNQSGENAVYLPLLSIPELIKKLEPALRFAEKCDAKDKSAHIFV